MQTVCIRSINISFCAWLFVFSMFSTGVQIRFWLIILHFSSITRLCLLFFFSKIILSFTFLFHFQICIKGFVFLWFPYPAIQTFYGVCKYFFVLLYRVLCERSAKQYQQTVLEKIRKNLMSSWLPFLKLKGLLASEISKFTKICRFQKMYMRIWGF